MDERIEFQESLDHVDAGGEREHADIDADDIDTDTDIPPPMTGVHTNNHTDGDGDDDEDEDDGFGDFADWEEPPSPPEPEPETLEQYSTTTPPPLSSLLSIDTSDFLKAFQSKMADFIPSSLVLSPSTLSQPTLVSSPIPTLTQIASLVAYHQPYNYNNKNAQCSIQWSGSYAEFRFIQRLGLEKEEERDGDDDDGEEKDDNGGDASTGEQQQHHHVEKNKEKKKKNEYKDDDVPLKPIHGVSTTTTVAGVSRHPSSSSITTTTATTTASAFVSTTTSLSQPSARIAPPPSLPTRLIAAPLLPTSPLPLPIPLPAPPPRVTVPEEEEEQERGMHAVTTVFTPSEEGIGRDQQQVVAGTSLIAFTPSPGKPEDSKTRSIEEEEEEFGDFDDDNVDVEENKEDEEVEEFGDFDGNRVDEDDTVDVEENKQEEEEFGDFDAAENDATGIQDNEIATTSIVYEKESEEVVEEGVMVSLSLPPPQLLEEETITITNSESIFEDPEISLDADAGIEAATTMIIIDENGEEDEDDGGDRLVAWHTADASFPAVDGISPHPYTLPSEGGTTNEVTEMHGGTAAGTGTDDGGIGVDDWTTGMQSGDATVIETEGMVSVGEEEEDGEEGGGDEGDTLRSIEQRENGKVVVGDEEEDDDDDEFDDFCEAEEGEGNGIVAVAVAVDEEEKVSPPILTAAEKAAKIAETLPDLSFMLME